MPTRTPARGHENYTEETAAYRWERRLYPLRKRVSREQRIRLRAMLAVWWMRNYKHLPTQEQLSYMMPLEGKK